MEACFMYVKDDIPRNYLLVLAKSAAQLLPHVLRVQFVAHRGGRRRIPALGGALTCGGNVCERARPAPRALCTVHWSERASTSRGSTTLFSGRLQAAWAASDLGQGWLRRVPVSCTATPHRVLRACWLAIFPRGSAPRQV